MNVESIVCYANNLHRSAKKVIATSPDKESTLKFKREEFLYIDQAQTELRNRTWKIEQMQPFIVYERGHKRKVKGNAPYDRMIIHSYLDFALEPELSKYLIYDNYSSQIGKGIFLARERFKEYMHFVYRKCLHNNFYVLLIDFSKFYDNVQHQKLLDSILEKISPDPFHEYMLLVILDSMKVDVSYMSDEEYENCLEEKYIALDHLYDPLLGEKYMEKGLNIGNPASQTFSVYYPTRLDTFYRCTKGIHAHGRYMDDTFIISDDLIFLKELVFQTKEICADMGLYINEKKTQIYKVSHNFKYLNRIYRMTKTGHLIERAHPSSIIKEMRKLRKFQDMLQDGSKSYKEIENQYISWYGDFKKVMTLKQRERMNDLYNSLFIEDFIRGNIY